MRMKFLDFGEFYRVAKLFFHDSMASTLRKYVVYSVVFHVVLIGALSVGMFLPKKAAVAQPPSAGNLSQPGAAGLQKTPPAPAAEAKDAPPAPAGKPAAPKEDDYYKRSGVDNTPAKPDEIPKNPFDVKDDAKKTLDGLK